MKDLILNNWGAKIVSLALAVVLWAVIRKNIETTPSPSRFQFETQNPYGADERFQIDPSRYAKPNR